MIAPAFATAVAVSGCAALVYYEAGGPAARPRRRIAKTIASIGFVAIPLVGGALAGGVDAGNPAPWIVIGLLLGAIGDVLLLFPRAFTAGLAVFLLGHVSYIVAFSRLVPIAEWPRVARWPAMGAACAGATALAWLWPHTGKLRLPVTAYVAAIVVMVIGAAAVGTRLWPAPAAILIALGAVLFFASDISVARDRFVSPGLVNKVWGLPAYYAGQILIAWATLV